MESNAKRFINAFNQIDYALRTQHNFRRSMGFSDMIRRTVPLNHLVRKYEDDLIDFGRLRNSIIHGSNDEIIIAEPHLDVVEKIEFLAKLISTPPKILDCLEDKEVFLVNYDVCLKDVIKTMYTTGFSNIPVQKDGALVGVANGQKILNYVGKIATENENIDEVLKNTLIYDVVNVSEENTFYMVMSSDVTIDKVLAEFLANRKLLVVIITKSGTTQESPLAIITASDYKELNKILENY